MQRLVPTSNKVIQNLAIKCSKSSASSSLNCRRAISASSSILANTSSLNKHNSLNRKIGISAQQTLLQTNLFNLNNTSVYLYSSNVPEHTKVRLPALSPTMEHGTLAKWAKKEGDHVLEGDLIAEIETDKATMGLESSEEGYLAKILVAEKTKDIPLKTLLCIMVKDKSQIASFANYQLIDSDKPGAAGSTPAPAPAAAPAAAAAPTPKPASSATTAPPPPPPQSQPQAAQPQQASTSTGGRIFATPLARRLAAERNIDLSQVQGNGPDKQIRGQDVLTYTTTAPASKQQVAAAGSQKQQYEDIALNNFRSVTAKRLLLSKQTIPHYYLTVDFEIDNALKVRQDLNEQLVKDNIKISLNDLVIKAAALACKKVPEANSAWMDTFIRKYINVDINVAVATDNGLITPIVFNADKKGLTSISFDVNSLAQKARANKLQPHEFQGGTFTVSNLGMFGIKTFSAVINPPQSCILAVGGSEKRLVPDEKGGHRVATFMAVTLSCDHRVVDGAVGAKWLQHFKKFMENPASMLL